MKKNENFHFDEINRLYCKYHGLLKMSNVEIELQILREKIVREVCCIFYLDDNYHTILDEADGHSKKKANKEFSYEIFCSILESFRSFDKKEFSSDQKNEDFASYVTSTVNRKLKYLKAQEKVKTDNSVKIPREKINLVRKIKKAEEHFSFIKNSEKRGAQIKRRLGISDADFKVLYPLALNSKISLDSELSDDSDGETLLDVQRSQFPSAQEILEKKETLHEILGQIEREWEKTNDEDFVLADALTVDILGTMFGSVGSVIEKESSPADYANRSVFDGFRFINKKITHNFFTNPSYKLPTQTEIGLLHGGMTKAGISKKLSRFYEKLKKSQN